MKSKKQQLKSWKIYAILDVKFFPSEQRLLKKFRELVASGVDALQLRFKDCQRLPSAGVLNRMRRLTGENGIVFLINDRVDIALGVGADGVHLGKSDIAPRAARKLLGAEAIIGRTIRGLEDHNSLNRKEVDYVAIGPVFKTPLKPHLAVVSDKELSRVVQGVACPLVAIGGINDENAGILAKKGIKTVAFVRYGVTEKNTKEKIKKLKKALIMEKKC